MHAKITALTPDFAVASQIVATDIPEIAAAGYRTVINNRPDGEESGQLAAGDAKKQAEALGLSYRYLPVTASSLTVADIDAFRDLLATLDGPILAHCRSGTRCYLLWAAMKVRDGKSSADAMIHQAADRGFDISSLSKFTP